MCVFSVPLSIEDRSCLIQLAYNTEEYNLPMTNGGSDKAHSTKISNTSSVCRQNRKIDCIGSPNRYMTRIFIDFHEEKTRLLRIIKVDLRLGPYDREFFTPQNNRNIHMGFKSD